MNIKYLFGYYTAGTIVLSGMKGEKNFAVVLNLSVRCR
jgi:hypothetical protein